MIIRILFDKVFKAIDPVKFARKQGVKIGENCEIFSSVNFGSEPYLIEIGNHVEITSDCKLITHDGGMWPLLQYRGGEFASDHIHKYGKIIIGDNSYLGNNVIVLPGVSIGKNCIIGAGSVVTKSIPDNSVCCGVPAKVIKTIDQYADECIANNLAWNHENYKKDKKTEILRLINKQEG